MAKKSMNMEQNQGRTSPWHRCLASSDGILDCEPAQCVLWVSMWPMYTSRFTVDKNPTGLLCTRLPIHQSCIQLHCISLKYLHKVSNMTYRCCHQSKHRDQDLMSHHPIIIVWHWKPIPIFPNKWIIIVFEKKDHEGRVIMRWFRYSWGAHD